MTPPLLVVIVSWAVFLLYWLLSAFNTKRYIHRGSWGLGLRFLILIFLFAFYQFPPAREFLTRQQFIISNTWVQWLGAILCVGGVAFAIWARAYLGSNWGTPMSLKQGAELVTTGPYAFVRHPIYTGMILGMIGTTLVIVWWVVPFLFAFLYFVYSAKTEEKIMSTEFPNQYPEYKRRTKMFIPFVF